MDTSTMGGRTVVNDVEYGMFGAGALIFVGQERDFIVHSRLRRL